MSRRFDNNDNNDNDNNNNNNNDNNNNNSNNNNNNNCNSNIFVTCCQIAWCCNYKDLQLRGTHLYIKYLRENIYNDYNNVALFWIFHQLSRIDAKLFKNRRVSSFSFNMISFKLYLISLKFRRVFQKQQKSCFRTSKELSDFTLSFAHWVLCQYRIIIILMYLFDIK